MDINKRLGRIQVSMEFIYSALGFKSTKTLKPKYVTADGTNNTISIVVEHDTLSEVPEGGYIPILDLDEAKNMARPFGTTVIVADTYNQAIQTAKDYGYYNTIDIIIVTDTGTKLKGLRRPNIIFANGWTKNPNIDLIMQELRLLDF